MHRWLVPRLVLPAYERLSGARPWTMTRQMQALQWLPPEELERRALSQLQPLLVHAVEHVPFYGALFQEAGARPADVRSLSDLARLPITRKADLRAESPGRTTARNLLNYRGYRVLTTGSTGLPFEFFGDSATWSIRRASFMFFLDWAGVGIWDRRIMISVPSFLEAPRPPWLERTLRSMLLGEETVRVSGVNLSIADLHGKRPYFLWTLPSYAARLGAEILGAGIKLPRAPRVVITFGETLTAVDAVIIEQAYRCPVVNHYSASEVYHLGQTCPDNHGMLHTNAERAIVRIVRADGSDAAPGEEGRVVITDLHNYVMPFINYEVGDWAVAGSRCPCGRGLPTLNRIEGRIGELIRTPSGRVISAGVLGDFLLHQASALVCISEFQALQADPNELVLRVVPTASYSVEYGNVLQRKLAELVGEGMVVRVETVHGIPPGPSGKRALIQSGRPWGSNASASASAVDRAPA